MPIICVLSKAYIRAHTRRLPSGKTITIQPYFTKRTTQKEGAKERKRKTPEHPVPKGVHAPLRPEQLSARLVRHVEEGTMSHAEAHANLDHLERRAHAGHHLEHGHGPSWTPEETHAFIAHARGRLTQHKETQDREAQAKRIEEVTGKREEEKTEEKPQEKPRPAQGITQRERQQTWDERMKQRQQAEREKQEQKPRRTRGQRHREQVQELLRQRTVGKSLPRLVLVLKKAHLVPTVSPASLAQAPTITRRPKSQPPIGRRPPLVKTLQKARDAALAEVETPGPLMEETPHG